METPVSPKVTIAVVAGAIVTIIQWVIDLTANVEIPVVVQGALTTVVIALAAWFTRDKLRDAGQAAVNAPPTQAVGTLPEVQKAA